MTQNQMDPRELRTLDLVELARAGDAGATEEIYARYADRVRKIVRMRLHREQRALHDSGDVLQKVFIDAFRNLGNFTMETDSSLIRWLAAMARNRVGGLERFDRAEKRDRGREVRIESRGDDGATRRLPLLANLRTPSMEIGREEEAEFVRECIAELDERYREVVVLRDYVQASWAEIAEELGSPSPEAARALYDRALNKLGAALRKRGIE